MSSDAARKQFEERMRATKKMARENSRVRYKDPMMNAAFEATKTKGQVEKLPQHTQELIRAAQTVAGKKLPVGKDHLNRLRTMRREVMPVVMHSCPIGHHEYEKPHVDEKAGDIIVTRRGTFCAPAGTPGLGEDLTAAAWTPKKKTNALEKIQEIKYMLLEMMPGPAAQAHRDQVTYMKEVKESQDKQKEARQTGSGANEDPPSQLNAIVKAQSIKTLTPKFLEECKTMRQVRRIRACLRTLSRTTKSV